MVTEHRIVPGTQPNAPIKPFYLDWREQWSGLTRASNWTDFTFINAEWENQPYMGSWEFCVAILGIHIRLTRVYDPAPRAAAMKKMEEMANKIEQGQTAFPIEELPPVFKGKDI